MEPIGSNFQLDRPGFIEASMTGAVKRDPSVQGEVWLLPGQNLRSPFCPVLSLTERRWNLSRVNL